MALSNIFREPRREIIESIVGVIVGVIIVVPLIWLDYRAALWFNQITERQHDPCPVIGGMILVPIVVIIVGVILCFVIFVIHEIGEAICNRLEDRGINLRPRRD